MKRIIVVHGMKRSGNHGIINWLKVQDRFIFFNNVIPIAPILRGDRPFPEPEDFTPWLRRKFLHKRLRFTFFLTKYFLARFALIASLEDHELNVRPFLNPSCEVANVLILRDPYNLFSSRIRVASRSDLPSYNENPGPIMSYFIDLWKSYAREFLGLTNNLENKVCIYYNQWFSSQDYRRLVSKELNLEFNDRGFSKITRYGGGSSFDKRRYDGKSEMMDVLNRKDYLNDTERENLEIILDDRELVELTESVEILN